MAADTERLFIEALDCILRPVAAWCIRRSLKLRSIVERLKFHLVKEAERMLLSSGTEASASKISIMTGVHRLDVTRLMVESGGTEPAENLLTKVLGAWQGQQRFRHRNGRPRVLSIVGHESEFFRLVRSVSLDLNPYTVLFELERSGNIERVSKGVRIKSRFFLPAKGIRTGFSIAGRDVNDLLRTVEVNILEDEEARNLHIRTEYDRIPASQLTPIRRWLSREGSAFHRRVRKFLERYDHDISPPKEEPAGEEEYVRIGLSAFSWNDFVSKEKRKRNV